MACYPPPQHGDRTHWNCRSRKDEYYYGRGRSVGLIQAEPTQQQQKSPTWEMGPQCRSHPLRVTTRAATPWRGRSVSLIRVVVVVVVDVDVVVIVLVVVVLIVAIIVDLYCYIHIGNAWIVIDIRFKYMYLCKLWIFQTIFIPYNDIVRPYAY